MGPLGPLSIALIFVFLGVQARRDSQVATVVPLPNVGKETDSQRSTMERFEKGLGNRNPMEEETYRI
jgi:hypothetical protein